MIIASVIGLIFLGFLLILVLKNKNHQQPKTPEKTKPIESLHQPVEAAKSPISQQETNAIIQPKTSGNDIKQTSVKAEIVDKKPFNAAKSPTPQQKTYVSNKPRENNYLISKISNWLSQGKKIYRSNDSRSRFMTETEQKFFNYLKRKFCENNHLFAQVRIGDLMEVNWSVLPSYTKNCDHARYAISSLSVDYVITDSDFKIICAVELDDKSHQNPDRQERDKMVNMAFKSAGIRLLRYKIKYGDRRFLPHP